MSIRGVGIVGYGSFGKFVHTLFLRFAPQIQVRISSSSHEPDGKTFFSLLDVAQSDAVILCMPIHAYEESLRKIVPLTSLDTVLVDIATVKEHTLNLMKKYAGERPYISMHPMFGPESYEKKSENIAGFRIVMCDHSIPAESYASLVDFLRTCGFTVVEMTARDHDVQLAETLFLTHFIAQIMETGGFKRTDIDTVSFGYLMDAVESVRSALDIFKDVYRYVPHCKKVLKKFGMAEVTVQKLLSE